MDADTWFGELDHFWFEFDQHRLHALASGPTASRRLVFLLHGFPEFSYGWRHQLGPLAREGLRVVALDQRGCGLSSKPRGVSAYRLEVLADDVLRAADQLGVPTFSVVGHDWGGIVAWHLASLHAERIERAAILNAPHPATLVKGVLGSVSQAMKSSYIALFQIPWLPEQLLSAADGALLERALVSTSRPGTFSAEELAIYHQAWAEERALTSMLNWYRALPLAPSLSDTRVRMPMRLLWGDRDAALDASLAEAAIGYCDRGELVHYREATHWLHHELVEPVNQQLIEFLA